MLQTEFEFALPRGYVDSEGNLHKHGVMRLATAADEILPLRDPRVRANQAYLVVIFSYFGYRKLSRKDEEDLPFEINPQ